MELRHQRYFIAIAEELHFGRAAARLKISQPALSKQIKELETEVGAQLLWRSKREVRLTPAGLSFLTHAREVIDQIQRSITEAHSVGRGDLGSLEIGYISSASARIVPQVVRAFKARFPRVDVRLRLLMPPHHVGEIRNNQVDFVIAPLPVDAPDLAIEKIEEEPAMLAIPEGHPLAARTRISMKSLDGVPMVFWPRHVAPDAYDHILKYLQNAGARLNTVLETYPLNSMICAVAAGVGVTFVPDSARDNPQKGVVFRSLRPPRPTVEWGIVYKQKDLGGAEVAFLGVVRDAFKVQGRRPADRPRRRS